MNPRPARQSIDELIPTRKHRPDYGLVILATVLLFIGLIVMYAISPALAAQGGNVSDNYFVSRQFIAIILGFIIFWITAKIPINYWLKIQKPLILCALLLSLIAFAFGGALNARWIQLGIFSFQPVELVKFILVLFFASFLSKFILTGNHKLKELRPALILFAIFGLIIVVLQRDLGSAVVLMGMIAVMAFVAGLPIIRILIIVFLALAVIMLAISSTQYRRDRLLTFFQPERDCASQGYHACQALIAVGSGGLFGVGVGRSVQAYGYLPEAENDSIFAIYAEKFGFVGVIVLIGLVGALLLRILNIMQRAPNRFTQLVVAGVFGWLAIQSLINIGAMVGLLPLKGITLPFISYGGTSLLFSMAALGLVFQISAYTNRRKSTFDEPINERSYNEDTNNWRRNSRPRYSVTRRSI